MSFPVPADPFTEASEDQASPSVESVCVSAAVGKDAVGVEGKAAVAEGDAVAGDEEVAASASVNASSSSGSTSSSSGSSSSSESGPSLFASPSAPTKDRTEQESDNEGHEDNTRIKRTNIHLEGRLSGPLPRRLRR